MIRAFAFLALTVPVAAQDKPCVTYAQMLEAIEATGAKVAGAAQYNGSLTTEMLIVETMAAIILIGFDRKGCVVGEMVIEPRPKEAGA